MYNGQMINCRHQTLIYSRHNVIVTELLNMSIHCLNLQFGSELSISSTLAAHSKFNRFKTSNTLQLFKTFKMFNPSSSLKRIKTSKA